MEKYGTSVQEVVYFSRDPTKIVSLFLELVDKYKNKKKSF